MAWPRSYQSRCLVVKGIIYAHITVDFAEQGASVRQMPFRRGGPTENSPRREPWEKIRRYVPQSYGGKKECRSHFHEPCQGIHRMPGTRRGFIRPELPSG